MMNTPSVSGTGYADKRQHKASSGNASSTTQRKRAAISVPDDFLHRLLKEPAKAKSSDQFVKLASIKEDGPEPADDEVIILSHKQPSSRMEANGVHDTEAGLEPPPLKLYNPLQPEHRYTGLVDLPKVAIPKTQEETVQPPSMGRHSDKPDVDEPDAFFSFLMDAVGGKKK